jgi:hypothetical protein
MCSRLLLATFGAIHVQNEGRKRLCSIGNGSDCGEDGAAHFAGLLSSFALLWHSPNLLRHYHMQATLNLLPQQIEGIAKEWNQYSLAVQSARHDLQVAQACLSQQAELLTMPQISGQHLRRPDVRFCPTLLLFSV